MMVRQFVVTMDGSGEWHLDNPLTQIDFFADVAGTLRGRPYYWWHGRQEHWKTYSAANSMSQYRLQTVAALEDRWSSQPLLGHVLMHFVTLSLPEPSCPVVVDTRRWRQCGHIVCKLVVLANMPTVPAQVTTISPA